MQLLTRRALVMLTALAAAASAPADIEQSRYGAWTLRCEQIADGSRGCIMFQDLVLATGGQTVLQFAVGLGPTDGTPTVLVSLPLGISLPPGIGVRIDDGTQASFPVERCEPNGCQAGMKMRPETLDQLRHGKSVALTFHDGQRQPITMLLSLDGFDEAFAVVQASTQGPTTAPAAGD